MARRFNRKPLTDEERDARREADRDRIEQAARALLTTDGWQRWIKVRASNGLSRYGVEIRDLPENGPGGWCDAQRHQIVVASGSANQQVRTLTRELAHADGGAEAAQADESQAKPPADGSASPAAKPQTET